MNLRAIGGTCVPLDIEPEYLNPIVVLSLDGLLPGIELFPFVNILATGITPPAHKLKTYTNRNMHKALTWKTVPLIEQPVANYVDQISLG